MSGDMTESREAQKQALTEDENKKLLFNLRYFSPERMREWLESAENSEMLLRANETIQTMVRNKLEKLPEENVSKLDDMLSSQKAPAFLKDGLTKSDPPKPPESKDVEYLTYEERVVERAINTIQTVLIEDLDVNPQTHPGPWIERGAGRNRETGRLIILRIPAKEREVPPWEVMHYLGNVVSDHLSVHTANVLIRRQRIGYVFDRFYHYRGKRYERVCWVPDKKHQAALMYEKFVDPTSRKGVAKIARVPGTNNPKYEVLGAVEGGGTAEGYYRDLKRLYERFFLKRGEGAHPEDEALNALVHQIQPS